MHLESSITEIDHEIASFWDCKFKICAEKNTVVDPAEPKISLLFAFLTLLRVSSRSRIKIAIFTIICHHLKLFFFYS